MRVNGNIDMTYKEIINYVVCLILGLVLGYFIFHTKSSDIIIETKTIPVHDTITIDSIKIKHNTKIVYKQRIDTFYLIEKDTVYIQDVPINYYEYNDTIKNDSTSAILKINHHGFLSEIDKINLKYTYNYKLITTLKEPNKVNFVWFFGPTLGYGGFLDNKCNFNYGPYFGLSFGVGMGGTFK